MHLSTSCKAPIADCFSRHINWRIRLSATLQSTSRSQNYNKILIFQNMSLSISVFYCVS